MRQLRQMLRLHHDGMRTREIARSLGVARSTIQDNLKRAAAAGLCWPTMIFVGAETRLAPWFKQVVWVSAGRAAARAHNRRRSRGP